MDTPASPIQARLQEREEIISTLNILTRIAPPLLTIVFVIAAALAIIGVAQGSPDRAALTIALTIAPCTALGWVARHLFRSLIGHLDLLPPDGDDSTRR